MKDNFFYQIRRVAAYVLVAASTVIFTSENFAQISAKRVEAAKLVEQISEGKEVFLENVLVTGDFDLSKLHGRTNDAVYPEKNKTARVYSANIAQSLTFKNVIFEGKVIFFQKQENEKEISENRMVFRKPVTFDNCIFKQTADFELTNFNGGVSFANSTFKDKPSFIRIGLEKIPDFSKTIFEKGSIFKNFQNDAPRNLSAAELESFYRSYLDSGK